jgi:hypothetical protein
MLSCGSLTEIGSFDSKRKPFGLFLGPFRGPFFHQGLEWFLFVLFLTVLAFTHVSRSLHLDLIGCARKTTHCLSIFVASSAYTAALTTTVFLDFPPTATAMRMIFTAPLARCPGMSYRLEGSVEIKEFPTE